MRAQQHGEVFPILQVDGFISNEDDQTAIGLRVKNSGVGPALIRSVELDSDGLTVTDLNEEFAGLPPTSDISWTGLKDRALAPGDEITAVQLRWGPGEISREAMFATMKRTERWSLSLCYCSVFDRCWRTLGIGTAGAERVDTCPTGTTDVFANLGMRPVQVDTLPVN